MDKIKAFISDKKNTPIVGAVAGIVLVLVVLFYLKQFGIIGAGGGDEDTYSASSGTSTDATAPADPNATSPDGTSPSPTDTTATGGSGTTSNASPAGPPPSMDKIPPMLAYRKDPFMGYSGPPRKQDAMMAILPGVRRIRLAPARLAHTSSPINAEVQETLPPQPMRRVAGIMWGATVKAILESGGKTYVVSPGQPIPEERVRVESIEPTGLTLTTLDTKRPMSIRVNLAGSLAAQDENNPGGDGGNVEAPRNSGSSRSRGGSRPGNMEEAPPPGF